MREQEIKKLLQEHYLFSKLNDPAISSLIENSRLEKIHPGRLIWSKQEKVPHIAVILDGVLKISLLDPMGNEFAVKHITPVDSLGDASIFEDHGQLSDVVAVEESLVLFVNKQEIIKILKGNPEAGIALCEELSRRVGNLTTEVELQVFSRGTVRILYRLLQLKREGSQDIKITHAQLAELVGMSRERLTLALRDLEETGYITKKRGRIIINDYGRIRDLVRGSVF